MLDEVVQLDLVSISIYLLIVVVWLLSQGMGAYLVAFTIWSYIGWYQSVPLYGGPTALPDSMMASMLVVSGWTGLEDG